MTQNALEIRPDNVNDAPQMSTLETRRPRNARGSAVLLSVDAPIRQLIRRGLEAKLDLDELSGLEQLFIGLEQGRVHADTLVLGISLKEPVRIAQRIHSLGLDIPVLILTEPEQHDQLKRALKFAPFLGNDVTPCSTEHLDDLPGKLADMVERARKRHLYRGSVKAAQLSLGKISPPQPQITHYFERLLDRAPIGVLNLNVNGAILNLNRHACRVLGVNERDALGTPLATLFAAHERDRLRATIARCVAPMGRGMSESYQIDTEPVRYVEVIASSLVDRSGQLGATIILQNITGRIRAEEERKNALSKLQASERRYRELVETMNEGLALTDEAYRITFVNERFCDLFGYTSDEVIGRPLIDLVHEEAREMMSQRMNSQHRNSGLDSFETAWLTRGGRKIFTLTSPKSIYDQQGHCTGCLGVFTDITERKEVEQREKLHMLELAQVSRVSTIGEMSSQIAHELAQPLSAIGGLSSALLKLLGAGADSREEVVDALGDIQTQAKRAREIVMRLRNFVRHNELRHVPIELNELVTTVIRLANVDARWRGICVELALGDALPAALGDRILIEQVLLNLVRNACEAMQEVDKGHRTLTITTRESAPGQLEITVDDTGPGLDAGTLEKVCHPFFTTKADGMGMGLAIARSVVEAHGGQLSVANNPVSGASFSFTLPEATDD